MRIGIDVRELKKGVYTGLRSVLQDFLDHTNGLPGYEFIFFGNQHTDLESLPENGKKVVVPEKNTFIWDQFKLPGILLDNGVDVFFSPYIKTPLWRACPYVNTVADIIPLAVPRAKGVKVLPEKMYFFLYAFICSRRAAKIITLSTDAKRKITRTFKIDPKKIEVVYPSVAKAGKTDEAGEKTRDLKAKYELDEPYILYVGNFKPHKNVNNLVKAYDLLPEDVKNGYRLLLVGGSPAETEEMNSGLKEKGLSDRVIVVKNINREYIPLFMGNASLFVFPSLAEGFGIPPLEAMASGIPVASSNLAPMTEVLADAAVYFDPRSPEDISKTIIKLIRERELRKKLVAKGKDRISLFGTEKMSQDIMNVLEEACHEKTLFISSEYPPVRGGIATTVFNLWKRLPGEQAAIFTVKTGAEEELDLDKDLDITRRRYPLGSEFASRFIRVMFVLWHVWRLNCVRNITKNHCAQVMSAGLAGLLMKKLKNIPYVVYIYSADILEFSSNGLTEWFLKKILLESENIITNSNYTKSLVNGLDPRYKDKIVVLTPAVDLSIFKPSTKDSGILARYGVPEGHKILLTVSRLDPRKGHDNVIRALSEIIKTYPNVVYMMVGDGDQRGELEVLAREAGVRDKVIFTGALPSEELGVYYNACDLFIMVPRHIRKTGNIEGFGIVFLEANACGKPVIGGRSGGVSEAVVDGETGVLVDPENLGQIKDAILKLLQDEEYARKLGNSGLERVRRDFSWDKRVEELKKHV